MGLRLLRSKVGKIINNLQGWHTDRKIMVIESDDWGSIRMPSREIYRKCRKAGYPVDKTEYEQYDSLLSQKDLELLFELLLSFRDKNGNNPVITANCVVANPDFEKIKKDDFKMYHFELITETFKKYPEHENNFNLWLEGIENRIFFPQYHAREHLNVSLFMEALGKRDKDVHFSFDNQMPGCIPTGPEVKGNMYIEATKFNSKSDKELKLEIYLEGIELFEKLFGYSSETIIPPNYIWSPDFDQAVLEKGVKFFQGAPKYREPDLKGGYKYHSIYTGKSNNLGQIYLARNCIFEPSLFKLGINDPVERCLSDMSIAFKLKKPAIITSHRINYVGHIDLNNRNRTLDFLEKLISKAIKRWPDIEFMNSKNLGKSIIN